MLLEGMFPWRSMSSTPMFTHFTIALYLQVVYALEIIRPITITCIKISILLFYRRIFTTPTFLKVTVIMGAITILWCVGTVLAAVFECMPIHKAWYQNIPGTCIKRTQYYYGLQVPNIVTELIILVMPLSIIRRLQMPRSERLLVSGVFMVGGM